MATNNPCTICGKPGLPGLLRGAGKCQYHWNVGAYGKAWADKVEAEGKARRYTRVIPRDLFNEANLMKCYGQLYLCLEKLNAPHVSLEHEGGPFDIRQDDNDGSTTIVNVALIIRGRECALHRPMNSREAWPLYLTTENGEEIEVFDAAGAFSAAMLQFIETGR